MLLLCGHLADTKDVFELLAKQFLSTMGYRGPNILPLPPWGFLNGLDELFHARRHPDERRQPVRGRRGHLLHESAYHRGDERVSYLLFRKLRNTIVPHEQVHQDGHANCVKRSHGFVRPKGVCSVRGIQAECILRRGPVNTKREIGGERERGRGVSERKKVREAGIEDRSS